MPISKKTREQMLKLCGSICHDDGHAAKSFLEKREHDAKGDEHRRQRFCRQVARTLLMVIPSDINNGIELELVRVVPGSNRSVLRVQFRPCPRLGVDQQQQFLSCLQGLEGWLRAEVAARISRKRVPQLRFELIAKEPQDG